MKSPHIFYIILQQLTNINNKGRDEDISGSVEQENSTAIYIDSNGQ